MREVRAAASRLGEHCAAQVPVPRPTYTPWKASDHSRIAASRGCCRSKGCGALARGPVSHRETLVRAACARRREHSRREEGKTLVTSAQFWARWHLQQRLPRAEACLPEGTRAAGGLAAHASQEHLEQSASIASIYLTQTTDTADAASRTAVRSPPLLHGY